jgi:hypothetical protein
MSAPKKQIYVSSMNNRETKCRGQMLCRCNIENPKFFVFAKETTQKRRYFETGIKFNFLRPVFFFGSSPT